MKKRIYLLLVTCLMMAAGMTSCSKDSDNDGANGLAEEYLSGRIFKSKDGNVYFYRNGSFLFEPKELAPAAGMLSGAFGLFAFGTWDAVGDMATTTVKADCMGMDFVRANVPEKIRLVVDDKGKRLVDGNTGELIIYNYGSGFIDVTNAGSDDNCVKGSWRTSYFPEKLGISVKSDYYADLGNDGTATLTGEEGSGLEVKTKYKASRGKITFDKFLNGKTETFYYAFTKSSGMWFLDMETGTLLFCWYKK